MAIQLKHVDFSYGAGTAFAAQALHDVSFTIPSGSYTALIGQTGSGKSTAVKHLNALVLPTKGEVWVDDFKITPDMKQKDVASIRKKVGMVFQFPEAQLFEETVLKDVMFGPKNFGVPEAKAELKAIAALKQCGLNENLYQKSPFDLSGGQMRRVAIAGILAMEPEILVLDEPTAGLDPLGRYEMMQMFYRLYQERHLTVVLVTHQMNDVVDYANHVIVMEDGCCLMEGTPAEVFSNQAWLKAHRLELPDTLQFTVAFNEALKAAGQAASTLTNSPLTLDDLADSLANWYHTKGQANKLGQVEEAIDER